MPTITLNASRLQTGKIYTASGDYFAYSLLSGMAADDFFVATTPDVPSGADAVRIVWAWDISSLPSTVVSIVSMTFNFTLRSMTVGVPFTDSLSFVTDANIPPNLDTADTTALGNFYNNGQAIAAPNFDNFNPNEVSSLELGSAARGFLLTAIQSGDNECGLIGSLSGHASNALFFSQSESVNQLTIVYEDSASAVPVALADGSPTIDQVATRTSDATVINSGYVSGTIEYQISRLDGNDTITISSSTDIANRPQIVSVSVSQLKVILPLRTKMRVRTRKNGGEWGAWTKFKTRDKSFGTVEASSVLPDDTDSTSLDYDSKTITPVNRTNVTVTATSSGATVVNSDLRYKVTTTSRGATVDNTNNQTFKNSQ